MREIHGATTEKIGTGLVCSVETFKGGDIKLVKRTSGFNGFSIYKKGNWVKSTKKLSKNSGLTFVPRINIKFFYQ